jgi:ABC-type glycerol-3-phosphate transport system permease component
MEKKEQFFAETKKEVQDYLEDRLLLFRLQTVQKLSKLTAALFSAVLVAVLVFFIILFLSIMAGYFFSSLTHSYFLGFGIVTFIYVILLFVVLKVRVFDAFITNTVINIIFDRNSEKEEDDGNATNSKG